MFAPCPAYLCAALIAPATLAAQDIDLRPKLTEGQQTRFLLELDQTTKTVAPGMPNGEMTQEINQDLGLLFTVSKVSEDGATVELRYETLKMSLDSPFGGKMEFDSSKPVEGDAGSQIAPMVRPIVGTVLTLTLDKDGNITKVEGGEGLATGPMAQMVGENAVKSNFGPIFSTGAGSGVKKVGETWTNTDILEDSPLGKFQLITTHTLESASGGEATVNLEGDAQFVTPPGAPAGAKPPINIKESDVNGKYVWDTEIGMLKSMDLTQRIVADMEQQGMSMSNNTTAKVKVTRQDGVPADPK